MPSSTKCQANAKTCWNYINSLQSWWQTALGCPKSWIQHRFWTLIGYLLRLANANKAAYYILLLCTLYIKNIKTQICIYIYIFVYISLSCCSLSKARIQGTPLYHKCLSPKSRKNRSIIIQWETTCSIRNCMEDLADANGNEGHNLR